MANPRKPIELRELTGNPGKRPLPAALPPGSLTPSSGRTPKGIAGDPDAHAAWRRLWKVREELGIQAAAYDLWAELLCRHWARATRERERGDLVTSEASGREVRYLLSEGGLTPASRARLGLSGHGEDDDEMADLIGRSEARRA